MTTQFAYLVSPVKAARLLSFVLLTAFAIAAFSSDAYSANLRKYAGIVVDAKTGKTLYSSGADATRYPASVTKVMTLYLVFQELEAKRMTLSTRMRVSKYAAAAQPSKLYLKVGSTITVSDAIKALLTKSANDVARVVAEHISGTEGNFARRMTKTARAMGMSRTTYRNANGLPHTKQITTVRDQALLGRAIFQHYPQYYKYFKTRSFRYRGKSYGNHNRLLGKVRGVDGLKTGYTRASGFNLLTSARYNGRHIVVAAFGFSKSASRNAKVTQLVGKYLSKAKKGSYRKQARIRKPKRYGGKGAAPAIGAGFAVASVSPRLRPLHLGGANPVVRLKQTPELATLAVASLSTTGAPRPVMRASVLGPNALGVAQPAPVATKIELAELKNPTNLTSQDPLRPGETGLVAIAGSALQPIDLLLHRPTSTPPLNVLRPPLPANALGYLPASDVENLITGSVTTPQSQPSTIGGWIVQLGAAPSYDGAMLLINNAKKRGRSAVKGLSTFVQEFQKGGTKYYRARIGGFANKVEARATCKKLKGKKISCLAMPI